MARILEFTTNPTGRRRTIRVPVAERTEPLEPPKRLTAAQRRIWDQFVEPATWLVQTDTALAYVFTVLMARQVSGEKMKAAELAMIRLLAGDLGLRPADRQRLASPKRKTDPSAEFFGDA